ncbi:MAG: hypothetical protein ABIJ43_02880 [Candidatus Beckwithbacteria bacterium]|nr:hypothetical protein [Patescibacteria group bacterium]
MKTNKLTRYGTLLFLLFFLSVTPVSAVDRMESDSYTLRFTNLNMTSGSKESGNFKILDTVGQFAPGEYSSSGYYVKAGFPYIKTIIAFAFTISDLSIDFGSLPLSTLSTQTNTLSVSSGGAGGYSVTAQQNHSLKLQTSPTTIPDTTCNTSCDETTADIWTSTGKYGFGYNMQGNDIPIAFIDSTYFKQFANISTAETPQIVMSSINVGTNRTATVTYQANISGSQAAGDYENQITYTAIPGY